MQHLKALRGVVAAHFRWEAWEALIRRRGITLDRPYRSAHPRFPHIIYPLDYGYIPGTLADDGSGVDVFAGSAPALGLVGLALARDYRQDDREVKFLYGCTPEEVYLVHGFLNFDPSLLEALLVLRRPLPSLWAQCAAPEAPPRH